MVRAPKNLCRSSNCPRFNLSIHRHNGIWGPGDEAVSKNVHIMYWSYFYTQYMITFRTHILWVPAVEGSYCKRPIQCLASSKRLFPHPLTARRVCTVYPPPPHLWCWGSTHSLGGEGVGGQYFEDARHSSVLYICKYFVGKGVQWSSNKLTSAENYVSRLHLRNLDAEILALSRCIILLWMAKTRHWKQKKGGGGGGMLCNDPSDRIGGKVGNFAAAFSLPN